MSDDFELSAKSSDSDIIEAIRQRLSNHRAFDGDLKDAIRESASYLHQWRYDESKSISAELSILLPVMAGFLSEFGDLEDHKKVELLSALNDLKEAHLRAYIRDNQVNGSMGHIIDDLIDSLRREEGRLYSSEHADLQLPEEAPAQYLPRRSGRASGFLQKHYGTYIEAGICFRPDVKRLDPKLEMALRNEFKGKPEALRAILPNKTDEVSARLEAAFGEDIAPEKRKRAVQALSYAKQIKTPK